MDFLTGTSPSDGLTPRGLTLTPVGGAMTE